MAELAGSCSIHKAVGGQSRSFVQRSGEQRVSLLVGHGDRQTAPILPEGETLPKNL